MTIGMIGRGERTAQIMKDIGEPWRGKALSQRKTIMTRMMSPARMINVTRVEMRAKNEPRMINVTRVETRAENEPRKAPAKSILAMLLG